MICQHFRYEVGNRCVTVLTFPIHQGLIPQGEHLAKRCAQWVARREGFLQPAGRLPTQLRQQGLGGLLHQVFFAVRVGVMASERLRWAQECKSSSDDA